MIIYVCQVLVKMEVGLTGLPGVHAAEPVATEFIPDQESVIIHSHQFKETIVKGIHIKLKHVASEIAQKQMVDGVRGQNGHTAAQPAILV